MTTTALHAGTPVRRRAVAALAPLLQTLITGLALGNTVPLTWVQEPGADPCVHAADERVLQFTGTVCLELLRKDTEVEVLEAAYQRVSQTPRTVTAEARLVSGAGSVFVVIDRVLQAEDGTITWHRRVTVREQGQDDLGFAGVLEGQVFPGTDPRTLEGLLPGAWYRGNESAPAWAFGGAPEIKTWYVREDRLAAPLVGLWNADTGTGIVLARSPGMPPSATVPGEAEHVVLVDPGFTVGSLGFARTAAGLRLGRQYPALERERSYVTGPGYAGTSRYHPVTEGFDQESEVVLAAVAADSFPAFVSEVWAQAWAWFRPQIRSVAPADEAHRQAVETLAALVTDFGQSVHGIPCGADPVSGAFYSRELEMGFLGPNLMIGAALYRYGLRTGRHDLSTTGEELLDRWVRWSGQGLAHTRWSLSEGAWVDEEEPGRVSLRRNAEGHLYLLSALTAADAHGRVKTAWRQWVHGFAGWLVEHQHGDGSWSRFYRLPDNPAEPSRSGTYWPVPFLCDMATLEAREDCLDAAVRAGLYVWEEAGRHGTYRGGALDNPDVLDKEAALWSTEAFASLFRATGDRVWLERAQSAAGMAQSWHYVVDLPVPEPTTDWRQGDTAVGLGLIAVGHSGADTYGSLNAAVFLDLGRWTATPRFLDQARILLHNTRQPMDLDGSRGFALPALLPELWSLSLQWINTAGENRGRGSGHPLWVPWTTANAAFGSERVLDRATTWHEEHWTTLRVLRRFQAPALVVGGTIPCTVDIDQPAGLPPAGVVVTAATGERTIRVEADLPADGGVHRLRLDLPWTGPGPAEWVTLSVRLRNERGQEELGLPLGLRTQRTVRWSMDAPEPMAVDPRSVSAPHTGFADSVAALVDGRTGEHAGDTSVPRQSFFARVGTREQLLCELPPGTRVWGCRLYWYRDENCDLAEAWGVEARTEPDAWQEMQPLETVGLPDSQGATWYVFTPVTADALRVWIQQPARASVALREWRIYADP